jgi:hypothetical protein
LGVLYRAMSNTNNSWIEFLKEHKGLGLTQLQLQTLYKISQSDSSNPYENKGKEKDKLTLLTLRLTILYEDLNPLPKLLNP